MADNPQVQVVSGLDREQLQDYILTLKAIRSVRGFVFGLLVLSLLVPLAVCGAVRWGKIQGPQAVGASVALSEGTTTGPDSSAAGEQVENRDPQSYRVADRVMRMAPFVARMMTLLLILVYFLSVNVCLAARLGGAKDCIVAFFWAALLMLFLVPWHVWIGGNDVLSVFYSLDALLNAESSLSGNWPTDLGYYIRFLLIPFLGLLTGVVADFRFGRCYRDVMLRIGRRMERAVQ